MRSVMFVAVAVLSFPQVAFCQQFKTPRLSLRPPVAVTPSAAADSNHADVLSLAPDHHFPDPTTVAAPSKRTWIGAGVGFVVGGVATWAVLNTGGSTAPCDRDANQDAMSAGECAGITVLGGAAGALVGALVAHFL